METKYLDFVVTSGGGTGEKCEFGDMKNNSTNFSAHTTYSGAGPFGHKNSPPNEEEEEGGCRPKKVSKNVSLGLTLSNHNLSNQPSDLSNKKNISSTLNKPNTLNLSALHGSAKRKTAQNRLEMDEDNLNSMPAGTNNAGNNGNVSVVSSTGGQASNDSSANCLKVPPLRIVISSSSARSNLKDPNNAISQDSHGTSTSGIQTSARNYVVSSTTFDDSEQSLENNRSPQHSATLDNNFLSSNLSFGSQAAGTAGFIGACAVDNQPSNGSQSSGRITRSQRAAAQHLQLGDESNSRSSPSELDSTLTNNSESNAGPESTTKNEKESNKENKEHRRRNGRQKASIGSGNSNSSAANGSQLNSFGAGSNHSSSQHACTGATSSGCEGGAIEEDTDSMSSSNSGNTSSLQMPSYNCLHMYQSIRKQVDKRRQSLFDRNLSPKAPQGFQQYLLNTGNYTLENRTLAEDVVREESIHLPEQLLQEEQLCQMYHVQARERNELSVQHRIEKEKIKLSIEQEIIRVHGRAALAMSNRSQPLSFATIMRDEEIYNTIDGETDEKCFESLGTSAGQGSSGSNGAFNSSSTNSKELRNEYSRVTYSCVGNNNLADLFALTGKSEDIGSRCRFSGRLLHSWLQDVDDKWTKIKRETIFRQRREAESLHAIQKLHWQWKIGELGRKISLRLDDEAEDERIRRSEAWIQKMQDDRLVPLVTVNENFDLSS